MFAYQDLTLALDSSEKIIFDIKEADGESADLSSFNIGVFSITNIEYDSRATIGTVNIQPSGIFGRIEVLLTSTDMASSKTLFKQSSEDVYGIPSLNFAYSIKLDDEVKVRGKARIVKVG